MLEILEKFHSLGYIHNDMKPQNIMTKMPTMTEGAATAN
jgi:serine/threonine protein kinase